MSWEPSETELNLYFLELEGLLDRISHASTHYEVLGVHRNATGDDISQAQRRTMSVLKPSDSRQSSLPADFRRRIDAALKETVKSYMVLGNYGSRVEYDNSLVRRAPVPIRFDLGTPSSVKRPSPSVIETKLDTPAAIQTISSPQSEPSRTDAGQYSTGPRAGGSNASSRGASQDTIAINHSSAQVLYTKSVTDRKKDDDKRKYQRLRLSIPTYVTGYDQTQGKWTEVAHTLDVSIGGVSIQLAKEMPEGAVVHLTFPMPTKLRRHGYSDPTYQVYAIVRRVRLQDERHVVGLEFLGAHPPPGYLQKPWAKFHTKW